MELLDEGVVVELERFLATPGVKHGALGFDLLGDEGTAAQSAATQETHPDSEVEVSHAGIDL